jgi:Protein required for attachment to host cells
MYYVIVVDAHVARVYGTDGPGHSFELISEALNAGAAPHERDLVSARPGRVINRAAGIRQTLAPTHNEGRRRMELWFRSIGRDIVSPLVRQRSGIVLTAAPRATASILAAVRPRTVDECLVTYRCNLAGHPLASLQRRLQPSLQSLLRLRPGITAPGRALRLSGSRSPIS